MKLKENNSIVSATLTGLFLALTSLGAQAGEMGPVTAPTVPGNVYVGVFGGGGSSSHVNLSQYGTAFFTEAEGGPLAIDAFGQTNSRSVGIVGGQIGYRWIDITTTLIPWAVTPVFELEGYYLSKSNFTGNEINNQTERLAEHDFAVTYPTSGSVFLINSVLNFNSNSWFSPYIGAGIGGALLSISGAQATQVSPPEANVNHYNANPNDKDSMFAGQVKAGATFALTQHIHAFAEYRWLYLAPSTYTFGSTVYPAHAATSAWQVELSSQTYNMGAAGLRYTF